MLVLVYMHLDACVAILAQADSLAKRNLTHNFCTLYVSDPHQVGYLAAYLFTLSRFFLKLDIMSSGAMAIYQQYDFVP